MVIGDVVALSEMGLSNRAIARKLGGSSHEVRYYLRKWANGSRVVTRPSMRDRVARVERIAAHVADMPNRSFWEEWK